MRLDAHAQARCGTFADHHAPLLIASTHRQGKESGRLEEEECQDAQTVRDFVAGGRGGAK